MLINRITKFVLEAPNRIFLVDGIGALISSLFYISILAPFESDFGIPIDKVYVLTLLALGYAMYSLICYFKPRKKWQVFLKIIAIANILHCLFAVGLLFYYREQVTHWGIAYFVLESLVVLPLAFLELKLAR
ncbi:MAG: hypothetical protein P1U56_16050 [Saprospiraceae bacterium]|nr:hypothetical protein [Saprospiraceae bacterium]